MRPGHDRLPDGWAWRRLDTACFSVADGDWVETKDQGGDAFRLLQVSNIGVGEFRETGTYRFVTRETFERLRCTAIKPGHVLVSRMPDPVGRAWHVRELARPAITAVDIAIVDPDPRQLDGAYLAYYLNSPQNLSFVSGRATGTTRVRITRRDFASFEIPLPPLPTQRKIAAILSAYDDLIENNNRRINLLEEMTQRIYREWFVDFRYPGHEAVPLVDSELGPIPSGWDVATLSSLATVVMGQSPPSSAYNSQGIGLPFHQGVGSYGAHFPLHRVYSTAGDRLANSGDILVSVRAPVGRINLADRRMILGRGLCGISARRAPREFLLHALKHFFRDEDVIGSGSIFQSVTRRDVEGLQVVWPGPLFAGRFGETAEPVWRLVQLLTVEAVNLQTTRDLLLPRIVSGEIDVADLDIEIPEAAA